jgi:putative transcriptional regulator
VKSHIRNTVQELRTERAVTQEELAQALGVSRQTIVAIERGNYAPSITLALRVGVFFKKPVEQIFTLHD